ncbi:MAG: hypothetical protein WAS21_16735, partial [Geminicoccaceae bacterium]
VQGNTLTAQRGTARGAGGAQLSVRDLASVVLIGGRELQPFVEKVLQAAADSADPTLDAPSLPVVRMLQEQAPLATTPGRILVTGNQIEMEGPAQLDTERPILAAVLVWGFQDVDFSHNQVEIEPGTFPYFADGFVLARTTRQIGNRLTEPEERQGDRPICVASLLSIGEEADTCALNQGTHCILPYGQRVVDSGNIVLQPSGPCRQG